MRILFSLLSLGWLAACASPSLSYTAREPAEYPHVAEYRDVAVGRFGGPEGGWFADAFERMLMSAEVDGGPWFFVSRAAYPGSEATGYYSGTITVNHIDERLYDQENENCVEWDGVFDCETRAVVIETCIETSVSVSVYPELIDRDTGQLVYSQHYSGTSSDTECEDKGGYQRIYVDEAALIREALSDTLSDIRRDIAPRNAHVTVRLAEEAVDPVVRADPMFAHAVEAASDNPHQACLLWEELYNQYKDAPAVLHNLAACSEAAGDFSAAQTLYIKAHEQASKGDYPVPEKASSLFQRSLERISNRRSAEVWFEIVDGIPVVFEDHDVHIEEAANPDDEED